MAHAVPNTDGSDAAPLSGPKENHSRPLRIGFLGGTFDPPHAGHLALARLALETLALDKVLVAPVGAQPLKRDRATAPFEDRLAMTRLAFAGDPRLELTSIDAPRDDGEPNYMIDTLQQLRAALPPETAIFAILGADAFLTIGKWHKAAELLVACPFVVGARPGFDLGRIAHALPAAISVASEDNHGAPCLTLGLRDAQHRHSCLYLLTDLQKDISATDIRAELRQGAFTTGVLAPEVVHYIRAHHLYDAPPPAERPSLQLAVPPRGPIKYHGRGDPIESMATSETRKMVLAAAAVCEDKKGEDTRVLELDPSDSGFTDFFVITSGTNDRQTVAIADEIEMRMKREFGTYANSVEGRKVGEWILLDYVDFVVHIFLAERRAFYDIERLRKSARQVDIDELKRALTQKTLAARQKAPAKKAVKTAAAPTAATKKPAAKKLAVRTATKKAAPAKKAPAKAAAKTTAVKKTAVKKAAAKKTAVKKTAAKKAPAKKTAKKS